MAENKKYELLPEDTVKSPDGRTLHRIRALATITAIGVAQGDLGGYIENEANLAQVYGNAWVSGNARVYGNAQVSGNAWVYGDAQVERFFPLAVRSDGHTFILVPTKDGTSVVIAGCQYRTVADYRAHTDEYGSAAKKAENLLILDFLEAQAARAAWS